ncbi:MAG: hypothetical protein ABL961_03225 [Vicinamibacterales bacterium]
MLGIVSSRTPASGSRGTVGGQGDFIRTPGRSHGFQEHRRCTPRHLTAGRTCIINAHRVATIRRADVIFAVQNGGIVERGTREELLARRGLHSVLHEIPFRADANQLSGSRDATA